MKHVRIEAKPDVMGGKPVVKGARISVGQILRECALGVTPEEFVAQHPGPYCWT